MNEKQLKPVSKFLSLVLRHQPEMISLELDEQGWADVDELITKLSPRFADISIALLEEVVATNDKKRFVFNGDRTKIRANQGHSIDVELNLKSLAPPEFLYHGTVAKFMEAIRENGLQKMSRQHVHLSADKETAVKVGSRRGVPVILMVHSGRMHEDGIAFYLSENDVWLTHEVPARYINL